MAKNEVTAKRTNNEASEINIKIDFTDDYAEIIGKLAVYLDELLQEKKDKENGKFSLKV